MKEMQTIERSLSDTDREIILHAKIAAQQMLRISEDASPKKVQERINEFLVGLAEETEINTLGEDCSIALGALWGDAICSEFGWEWIIAEYGNWLGIGISDPDRLYLALALNYFDTLIQVHPVEANLPSLQLYNCIKAGNLPDSKKRSYVLIAHSGS